jgi:hypothetical protein
MYGQMMSLQNMKAQQQQQAQLNPLILQQHQAQAQEASMKAAEMQQDQKDEEIGNTQFKIAQGDPKKFLDLATQNGMSTRGIARVRKGLDDHALALTKQNEADVDLGVKKFNATAQKNGAMRDRLTSALDLTDDELKARWPKILEGFNRDNLTSNDEHAQALKTFGEFPGREGVTAMRNELNTHASLAADAKLAAETATAEKAKLALQQAKIDQTRGKLRGVTELNQWNQIINDSELPPDSFGAPPFDAAGKVNPAAMQSLNRMGMTAAQIEAADRTAAMDAETRRRTKQSEEDRAKSLKLREDAAERAKKHETVPQRANEDLALAYQAVAESNANGGAGVDDAIKNVANTDYYENHPIGDNRGGVLKALRAIKGGDLRNYKLANSGTSGAPGLSVGADGKLTKIGATPPNGGGRGAQVAKPAADPPPATKKYTEAQIRQGAVSRGFKADGPEAEAAVKAARAAGTL